MKFFVFFLCSLLKWRGKTRVTALVASLAGGDGDPGCARL